MDARSPRGDVPPQLSRRQLCGARDPPRGGPRFRRIPRGIHGVGHRLSYQQRLGVSVSKYRERAETGLGTTSASPVITVGARFSLGKRFSFDKRPKRRVPEGLCGCVTGQVSRRTCSDSDIVAQPTFLSDKLDGA